MLVVMPDTRYAGAAEIEQNVFGQRAEIRAYQAVTPRKLTCKGLERTGKDSVSARFQHTPRRSNRFV